MMSHLIWPLNIYILENNIEELTVQTQEVTTHKPVHYINVLDTTWFKDGFRKHMYVIYIEKWP